MSLRTLQRFIILKNNLKHFIPSKPVGFSSDVAPQIEHEQDNLVAQKLTDRFLRKKDVIEITGLSASTIYRKENEGLFPPRIKISDRRIAWRLSDVNDWMLQLNTVAL